MDQIKTGAVLKELRKEHTLSQEQLADRFNTSSRSISRWENGKTMPDISMMIELAEFYDVDIREILRGERKSDNMNEDLKETLVMVADYTEEEKVKILNKAYFSGLGATVFSVITLIALFVSPYFEFTKDFLLISVIVGGIFSACALIAGIQLKGKTSKARLKKLLAITIPIVVVILIALIIFMAFCLPNILQQRPVPPGM